MKMSTKDMVVPSVTEIEALHANIFGEIWIANLAVNFQTIPYTTYELWVSYLSITETIFCFIRRHAHVLFPFSNGHAAKYFILYEV